MPTADRALFSIASRYVKLALDHATIMAGMFIGAPIVVLVTETNATNVLPTECVGGTRLRREYLLWPSFNHRNATIANAFRFTHFGHTSTRVGGQLAV